MLDELAALQTSDDQYWMSSLSFSVETRSEDGDELVHKTYTFTTTETADEWHFSEYKEKRCDATDGITDRNWRQSRHVWWHEEEEVDVEVPRIVTNKLADELGVDTVKLELLR